LSRAISSELQKIAGIHNIKLEHTAVSSGFRELIEKLADEKKVVILIDEYDKPIIDYLDDIPQAKENREILKNFYSVVKDSDKYLRFFFVTGVSKFSKVSMFSDLNNLDDISLDKNYSTLLGWTLEEIKYYFTDYIAQVQKEYEGLTNDIYPLLKKWYDGYSWDGENFVFNPVSLMNLLKKKVFNNYWFATGTPTFLMNHIREKRYTAFDIEKREVNPLLLEKYDLNNISLLPLLFQTGYLTIKKWDIYKNIILLDYPNKEVADSFTTYVLSELTIGELDKTGMLLLDIVNSFSNNDIQKFIAYLNVLFFNIPYTIIDEKEKYFHSLFYMVMKLVGFNIESEILTIDGRIDAVVKTDNHIYIIEFKINQSASKAIEQINQKRYAEKYFTDKRTKIKLGINFNSETREVDDYKLLVIE